MTAFRAAFKAYRMHQVLLLPRFARLTIALSLATAVFPVDAEYYFNRKRTARAVLTGMCYSAGSAMRHGSSSLTRLTGQSAMTP
ncbi:hypothetical protein ABWG49_004503, partial [Escherichia coli O157:H7]